MEAVRQSVERLTPDYAALLDRARAVQSEMLNRVTVDFGGASQYGLSSEELLSEQRSSPGYCGAFLEKLFEMCRYWFILTSGKYCTHVGRDERQHQPADCARRPGRSPGRHGCLLQLDGEPVPGLPHQRQEHLRHARRPLFPHADQGRGRRQDVRLRRLDRRDVAASVLAFRRRLVRPPVLGPLPGNGRSGLPPQSRGAGLQGPGAVLRGLPDGHRQERELHLRPVLLAGEPSRQPERLVHAGDQLQHGHLGVPGGPGQSGYGLRTAGHRGRQRAEMEGDAGQAAALPAGTGRRHEGMGVALAGGALRPAPHLSSLRRLAGRRDRPGPHAATGQGRADRQPASRSGAAGRSWPLPSRAGGGAAQGQLHGGQRTAATD